MIEDASRNRGTDQGTKREIFPDTRFGFHVLWILKEVPVRVLQVHVPDDADPHGAHVKVAHLFQLLEDAAYR